MNPGTHGELGDEDITTFGEKDGGFCRYHLDFWVGLHDLLNASEGQLVDFEVMRLGLEVIDSLLPISGQNVSGWASESLVDLLRVK